MPLSEPASGNDAEQPAPRARAPVGPVPPAPASAASSVRPTVLTGAEPAFEDGLSTVPFPWLPGLMAVVAQAQPRALENAMAS
jgi:hypothetical protein